MSLSPLSVLGQTTIGLHAREDLRDWLMRINDHEDPEDDFDDEDDDWDADMELTKAGEG